MHVTARMGWAEEGTEAEPEEDDKMRRSPFTKPSCNHSHDRKLHTELTHILEFMVLEASIN